jgi:hypothetical protein
MHPGKLFEIFEEFERKNSDHFLILKQNKRKFSNNCREEVNIGC